MEWYLIKISKLEIIKIENIQCKKDNNCQNNYEWLKEMNN